MQEVYEYLKKCGTYYLATEEGGQPRIRPFGTIDLFEGRLYIQTGKSKDCYKQIVENPKVEICACDGPTWLRVAATATPDERTEPQKHMLDAYPELRGMYREDDGNNVVLYLKDVTATFFSFTASARTVTF